MGLRFNGYRAAVWEDEALVEMDSGQRCRARSMSLENQIIHLKLFNMVWLS